MSITRTCSIVVAVAALAVVPTASAAPPANDDAAAATAITSLPFDDTVDLSEATVAGSDPQDCGYSYQTVWYSFTPAADATLRADSSGSSFPANLTVFRQSGGLSFVACGYYSNPVTFAVQGGQTYYIEAGNPYGNGGTLHMS